MSCESFQSRNSSSSLISEEEKKISFSSEGEEASTMSGLSTISTLSTISNIPGLSTIAIFDWDNTLFCTDYLDMLQLDYKAIFSEQISVEQIGAYLRDEIQKLEEKIINLFSELIETEVSIFIVTNAGEKWIKNCLNHFLPELNEFIEENSIKIYSAKKLFEKTCPLQKWKAKCFKKLIIENFTESQLKLKVLAVGDSTEEKLAALSLKSLNFHQEITVKFLETKKFPQINILMSQIDFIADNYQKIIESNQFFHKIFDVNKKL